MNDTTELEYKRTLRDLEEFSYNRMKVPVHIHRGIADYITRGVIPGDFLQGMITCDLRKVMWHADDKNQKALAAIYSFFYNYAPTLCWGSKENMLNWADKLTGGKSDPGEIDGKATIAACEAEVEKQLERERGIRELAHEQYHCDGEIEIDDSATVSEGDGNGAYVQAWVWVDFSGTEFDKEVEG